MDCLQAQDDEVSYVRICIRKKYDRIYIEYLVIETESC